MFTAQECQQQSEQCDRRSLAAERNAARPVMRAPSEVMAGACRALPAALEDTSMRTPEECFKHAEFCERQATEARNSANKAFFIEAAEEWRRLANDRGFLRAQPFMRATAA